MEFEKGKPSSVERVVEIDTAIKNSHETNEELNLLTTEKRNLLINFTDQQIQEYLNYTMQVLKNSRNRNEVESDIRHLINTLRENK